MQPCTGHRRHVSNQGLGLCVICAHQDPEAVRQIDVPAPGVGGVWSCPQWLPLQLHERPQAQEISA